VTHPLLALQAADTMAGQLRHRREHLAERDALAAAHAVLAEADTKIAAVEQRIAELTAEIEADEARGHALGAQRTRLEAQLKTVMAIRAAEALQHELETIAAERDALDDAELAALDEQAQLDDELAALTGARPALHAACVDAQAALDAASAAIDAELATVAAGHDALRGAVDPAQLAQYDRLRQQHTVAAAALINGRCDGCHLDLSAGELDGVRSDAAGNAGLSDCPNCGRILVVG